MNPTLSYEATPPFRVPLSFFLLACLFGIAAGVLLVIEPRALVSRWTPAALAMTHLITTGFMLLVMLGALFQVLPVVVGARLPAAGRVAPAVLVLCGSGAASLSWGLGTASTLFMQAGGGLLAAAIAVFLALAGWGSRGCADGAGSTRDLRLALIGLAITTALGVMLVLALSRGLAVPILQTTNLHAAWGWLGWGGILLAATSWVVVPMFQITPPYPLGLKRYWAALSFALLVLWSIATLAADAPQWAGTTLLAGSAAALALATLGLLRRTRRASPDASFRTLQLAMAAFLGGALCAVIASISAQPWWAVGAGVLVLHGGFVSAISAMLYKIVPFLAWLHLTQARIKAPNMKRLSPDTPVRRQLLLHALTLPALLAAASGNALAGGVAGTLLAAEFTWLLINLLATTARWRRAQAGH